LGKARDRRSSAFPGQEKTRVRYFHFRNTRVRFSVYHMPLPTSEIMILIAIKKAMRTVNIPPPAESRHGVTTSQNPAVHNVVH
ncbi:MAG: hypothetical protein MJA29_00925, partial [Candidatus Omnitrophica bacterium]|nr:hypothetical protein [Candidatus Omnitrophota bacterium]